MLKRSWWLVVVFVIIGVATAWTQGLLIAKQSLSDTPFQSTELGFQLHPPAGWAVVNTLDGLSVQKDGRPITPGHAGVVAAFSEPSPTLSPEHFHATITVAARDLPSTIHTDSRTEITAFTTMLFSSLDTAIARTGDIQPIILNNMAGSQVHYEYLQSYGNSHLTLSTNMVAVVSQRQARCYLLTVTAPTESFPRHRRLFERVAQSFHDHLGDIQL